MSEKIEVLLKSIIAILVILILIYVLPGSPVLTLIPLNINTIFKPQPRTVAPSITPVSRLAVAITLEPTPTQACFDEQGQIEAEVINSQAMGEQLQFNVYLPPCYDESKEGGYPVLYMFHGQSYTQNQWISLGLTDQADNLILAGKIAPLIIVMPYERKSWDNPFKTGFSEAIINEMIPWIDEHFDTCRDRLCRAIGGLSRGAAWAIHLGFTEWQLFGLIGAHSAVPFDGDTANLTIWLSKITDEQFPKIYLDIGQGDRYLQYAQDFEAKLKVLGVPHVWIVRTGNHDEAYWQSHVQEYLLWYSANFVVR